MDQSRFSAPYQGWKTEKQMYSCDRGQRAQEQSKRAQNEHSYDERRDENLFQRLHRFLFCLARRQLRAQGVRDLFWLQGMQCSIIAAFDCTKAFSETDFTEDLKKIDVPTLILHGDADQIVPIGDSALLTAKIVKNSTLKVMAGAPHGMCTTRADEVNGHLLAFLKA
jgi:pimeloyl-ACP methyl ester carboxylesterase